MKSYFLIVLFFIFFSSSTYAEQLGFDGWITHPTATEDKNPVVLHFRRSFELLEKPEKFPITVTADNKFILYVNGTRVASGPSTGSIDRWRQSTIDISKYLKLKQNVVAAVVWNGVKPIVFPKDSTEEQKNSIRSEFLFKQTSPFFQQSVATGFRIVGTDNAQLISTANSGWRVKIDEGHSFSNGLKETRNWWYIAGQPEIIDASKANFNWFGEDEFGTGWVDAIPSKGAEKRTLVVDSLPQQSYSAAESGRVVRANYPYLKEFPSKAVTIPPHTRAKILIKRDAMISAYSELKVSGGKDSVIKVTYSEALYDDNFKKSDRNIIENRKPFGVFDTFKPNGKAITFTPLWWRTWLFLEISVETKGEPLVLADFKVFETGYPFEQIGSFKSSDPELKRIFDIGWRTARVDAHETYMDSSYWEQLQYTGDTRLQMLISYAVSGDGRLAEQAIDAFASSNVDGGLMEGAYPSRTQNVIAPFSLLWIGMLSDWLMYQEDFSPVKRNIKRMHEVLAWFDARQLPNGLQGKNPHWNFIDWAGQSVTDRDQFPSWGKNGGSCLMSVSWLGALRQAAFIEGTVGDKAKSNQYDLKASQLSKTIKDQCWSAERGLFADNPDLDMFSQHMNAMAVLYDVVEKKDAQKILGRIVAEGKGIDAPDGMRTVSYYYAWYLIQAFAHADMSDRYLPLLETWRQLLKLNYTTWPEERGDTRSDTHAWSAHPTADLLGIVAGVQPASAGYARVKIAPQLGSLTDVDATVPTPKGVVRVNYRVTNKKLVAKISLPKDLHGDFIFNGKKIPLTKSEHTFNVNLND